MKREERILGLVMGGSTPHTPRQGYEPELRRAFLNETLRCEKVSLTPALAAPAPPVSTFLAAQAMSTSEGIWETPPLPGGVWECVTADGIGAGIAYLDLATPARQAFKAALHPVTDDTCASLLSITPVNQSLGKQGMGAWGKGRNPFSKGFLPFPHIAPPLSLPHNAGGRL